MCQIAIWIAHNPAWISLIVSVLSLVISFLAFLSRIKFNKTNTILQSRPVLNVYGLITNPCNNTISFELVSQKNESILTGISLKNQCFKCLNPITTQIHLNADDTFDLSFMCNNPDSFKTDALSLDIEYQDVIGYKYITHIDAKQDSYKITPGIISS